MGIMGKFKKDTIVASAPQPTATVVEAPTTGTISLKKGSSVSLAKGAGNESVVVSNGWTATGKDYDLKALVRYHDGRKPIYVGAANDDEVLRTPEGAVVHGGDVVDAGEREKITIAWHKDIASVAVSSYSALENGAGSFKQYGVFVEIQNGPQIVSIAAADANADPSSYTMLFGELVFGQNGEITVTNLENYSRRGSEKRVGYKGSAITMDAGPEGKIK